MLCIDVYTTEKCWMKAYDYKIKNSKYGVYCTLKVNEKEKRKILRKLKWKNIKYRIYDSCWERSKNYRANFLKKTTGPYRCRYCNRWLKTEYMEVDHIIPVNKAKKSIIARILLKMQDIKNVNDIKNLAPSCMKCNARKKDKLGFWFIRGILGKYETYWNIVFIIKVILVVFIISIGSLIINSYITQIR